MSNVKHLLLLSAAVLVVAIVLLIVVFRDEAEAPEGTLVPNAFGLPVATLLNT